LDNLGFIVFERQQVRGVFMRYYLNGILIFVTL